MTAGDAGIRPVGSRCMKLALQVNVSVMMSNGCAEAMAVVLVGGYGP